MADKRPVVIIGGPPTSNGDLHIGHIAGPYLGADVHRRYLRAAGREAVFASCTDDSQTYLVTSAARVGLTPPELVEQSTENIQRTFEVMGVEVDGFSPTDDGYKALVYDYVKRLYDKGKLRLRKVRLPYSESKGEFLVEGFVGGGCPTCLADSRGGFCEGCGHPIDFDALIEPYSVLDPADEVTYRETEIMVFPVSEYREQLLAYYEERGPAWRPHVLGLMRELLSGPLPDFAITYPVKWGLPAPFLQTPGQRLNAWVEGMPASMYCTEYALRRNGKPKVADDDAWLAENNARVVVFMGFDPLFTWGVVHVAELMALEGRYVLPDTLLVNEFYELENEKFSTSKGHVVWARDLAAEVPRDIARFHLNLTAPEFARTNFSRAALEKVAGERLVTPWNELAETLAKLTAEVGGENGSLPVSTEATERAAAMVSRFALNYELEDFSLSRAADLIVQHVERLRAATERTLKGNLDQEMLRARLGDLFLELRALIGCASPILIDLAERAAEAGGFEPRITPAAFDVTHTTAFTVPSLEFPPTSEV
ncbi:class I tRNA ligase family protein [Amycolatopsis keratiniphila]|uniref:Methionine--tRNA ligase n=1 Tax=Amycolatopsis keratiniphila subsp. keratiniphila TaxID=227715 RepID=A0A1W2LV53_9PSEU|nr:class I tRNA ligase family protein [Amycolatopsis keratiniphila]ONF69969.1 methionine--tRNA ligase [Amycolatopsis keratiniphila subsp. keratiniphila]